MEPEEAHPQEHPSQAARPDHAVEDAAVKAPMAADADVVALPPQRRRLMKHSAGGSGSGAPAAGTDGTSSICIVGGMTCLCHVRNKDCRYQPLPACDMAFINLTMVSGARMHALGPPYIRQRSFSNKAEPPGQSVFTTLLTF